MSNSLWDSGTFREDERPVISRFALLENVTLDQSEITSITSHPNVADLECRIIC